MPKPWTRLTNNVSPKASRAYSSWFQINHHDIVSHVSADINSTKRLVFHGDLEYQTEGLSRINGVSFKCMYYFKVTLAEFMRWYFLK